MSPVIRRSRVEQIALLPVFAPVLARYVPVLLLDVEDDDAIGPVEQIGYDHANPLAAACGRGHDDVLLSGEHQVSSGIFADDQTLLTQQARLSNFTGFGKPCITEQAPLAWNQQNQQGRHDQREGNAAGNEQPFLNVLVSPIVIPILVVGEKIRVVIILIKCQ